MATSELPGKWALFSGVSASFGFDHPYRSRKWESFFRASLDKRLTKQSFSEKEIDNIPIVI
jgi:hypothetical protein